LNYAGCLRQPLIAYLESKILQKKLSEIWAIFLKRAEHVGERVLQ
jgi:hypothetical protein